MVRRSTAILFCLWSSLLIAQQTITNDSVIKMAKAGLSDDLIVSTIIASPTAFDATTDGIIALKHGGVSDRVVSTILLRALKTVPPTEHKPETAQSIPTPSGRDAIPAPSAMPAPQPPPPVERPLDRPPASPEPGNGAPGWGRISPGSRIVIAPMGGFETYFAAAVREKKVPVTLTLDKSSAQYFVISTNTEWEGFVYGSGGSANWNRLGGNASYGAAASSTRGLEASIMLIDARSKDIIWAYEVHKNSHGALIFGTFGARGQQSIAEACAKHLKEYIEKGK